MPSPALLNEPYSGQGGAGRRQGLAPVLEGPAGTRKRHQSATGSDNLTCGTGYLVNPGAQAQQDAARAVANLEAQKAAARAADERAAKQRAEQQAAAKAKAAAAKAKAAAAKAKKATAAKAAQQAAAPAKAAAAKSGCSGFLGCAISTVKSGWDDFTSSQTGQCLWSSV